MRVLDVHLSGLATAILHSVRIENFRTMILQTFVGSLLLASLVSSLTLDDIREHQKRALMEPPPEPRPQVGLQDASPLFHSVFYGDGRPGQVLVDRLGHHDGENKVQTGDPVSVPYEFIGAFGEIGFTSDGGITYIISCTSSLIEEQTIMTAAHCINVTRQTGKILIYVFGLSNVKVTTMDELAQKAPNFAPFDIERVYVHPNYGEAMTRNSRATIVNDVAIGRLYEPLKANGTKPICLSSDIIEDNLTGAGWGLKDCYSDSQEMLRKANGTVVSEEECNQRLRQAHLETLDQHLCATFVLNNGEPAAVAKGDSGGPLFATMEPGKFVQVGVVSFGAIDFGPGGAQNPSQYCMMKSIPQVYARVSYFRNFISGTTPNAQWC